MPEVIQFFPNSARLRRSGSKYDRYMDGRIYRFDAQEIAPTQLRSVATRFCDLARKSNVRVRTHVNLKRGFVVIQALKNQNEARS
jgi:hypothetical protein